MLQFNFDGAKKPLFNGSYSQLQVDSITAILKEAASQGITLKTQVAYILATAYHEAFDYDGKSTGKIQRFVPIKEKGPESYLRAKKYYPHIGYGFAQVTWLDNYKKLRQPIIDRFGKDIDVVKNPGLLLSIDVAAFAIVYGMIHGIYTTKKLSDFINSKVTNFKGARTIINGTDKAALIETYAVKFLSYIL